MHDYYSRDFECMLAGIKAVKSAETGLFYLFFKYNYIFLWAV